jgi:WD40 repeat protein
MTQKVKAGDWTALGWRGDGRQLGCSVVHQGESHGVQLWDAAKGQPLHNFLGHNHEVTSISWEPKGSRFVSSGRDLTVRVWEADRKEAVWVGVLLPGGHTATVHAGGRLDVSNPAAEASSSTSWSSPPAASSC